MSSQSVKTGSNVRSITYDVRSINEFRVIIYELLALRREFRAIVELLSNPIEVRPIAYQVFSWSREFRAFHEVLFIPIEVLPFMR
jgi:hypothetical protein